MVEHEGATDFKILTKFKTRSGKSMYITAKDFKRVTQGSNEGDVVMDLTAPEAAAIFLGDHYGLSIGNWVITINDSEDIHNEELTIELAVASPTSTTIPTGTFKMSLNSSVGHFSPGSFSATQEPYPTYWTRKSPKAAVLITGGTFTITHLTDNKYTISADTWDMFGNRLKGSWTGPLLFFDKRDEVKSYDQRWPNRYRVTQLK